MPQKTVTPHPPPEIRQQTVGVSMSPATNEMRHPPGTGSDVPRDLQHSKDLTQRMRIGVDLAVRLLAGCDHAGITVSDHERIAAQAGSDDLPARAAVIQREVRQGPWVDRAGDQMVVVPDVGSDRRWPQWAARMHQELGVNAVVSLLLYTSDQSLGVLDLYADHATAFTPKDLILAQNLATHLAVAVADGQEITRRGQTITDNTVIGQAEGILMQRHAINVEEASDMLRRVSKDTGRTVVRVAQDLVRTRDLPPTS